MLLRIKGRTQTSKSYDDMYYWNNTKLLRIKYKDCAGISLFYKNYLSFGQTKFRIYYLVMLKLFSFSSGFSKDLFIRLNNIVNNYGESFKQVNNKFVTKGITVLIKIGLSNLKIILDNPYKKIY